jgi:hypothetical protein
VTKISLTGDGVTVEYFPAEPHSGFIVSLTISPEQLDSPILPSHLLLRVHPKAIAPNLIEHLPSMLLPFHYSQIVSDPSILHLLQLLQSEIQVPQAMNQIFVTSIVTVITAHLLQNLQMEQGRV